MFTPSSEAIRKKLLWHDEQSERRRADIVLTGNEITEAVINNVDSKRLEARLAQLQAEEACAPPIRAGLLKKLAEAEAREGEAARLARIETLTRECEMLCAEEQARAEKVAPALRAIEEHEGPRRRAIAEHARLVAELRKLRATDVPEPIGTPFERLIEPRWNANALAAEKVEIVLFSSCDPAETERLAAYSASRNAASMAQASSPRPQPVTRRAPLPAPMPSVDDELGL
ncbi:MAG: hypothetical protein IT186_12660 [Acidobacteria bacterium]|nr:hypothetical protein [Acidobacteriota bacterium]